MSNVLNLKGVKFFAIVVLAAALLATFGVVAVQKASADCSITMTLRVGSRGAEVMCLQTIVGATADGAFGPMTKAAVMAFQSSHGLVADGVVGPMTRAALMGAATGNFPAGCTSAAGYSSTTGVKCDSGPSSGLPAGCSSTAGYSSLTGAKCDGSSTGGTSSGPLSGGAGDINDVTLLGTPNSESVGEGESNHKVLGFEVEADNGSDLSLTSVKLELEKNLDDTHSHSTHLTDYIAGVSVWMGSTKVGSASVDDFTKVSTGDYSKSISLSGARVNADKKVKFYVAVDGQDSVDSGDMNDSWNVILDSTRFTDATGAILTRTEDNDADGSLDGGEIAQSFDIQSAADASNAKLTLTEASDNPNAGVVQVDDGTDTTDGVVLLKFKIKATGSDLWIDELPVDFTVTGATHVDDVTSNVTLTLNGEDFSQNPAGSNGDDCASYDNCVVTFDNLDTTLAEGDSIDGVITADVNGIGSALDSGDTLQADITGDDRDAAVVELNDENGDDLGTGSTDRVGTVTGEEQGFYNQGVTVTPGATTAVSTDGSSSAHDSYATFTIKFSVTAIGDDVYLDKTVAESSSTSSSPSGDNRVTVQDAGAISYTGSGVLTASDSNSDEQTNTFRIQNGQTAKFTLSVTSDLDPGVFTRAVLFGLEYTLGSEDGSPDNTTGAHVYNLDMGVNGSYKTDSVLAND